MANKDKIQKFCNVIPNGTAVVEHGFEYARGVVSGKILSCKKVKKACQRFLNDIERCNDDSVNLEFSYNRAQHVLDFFQDYLVHVKNSIRTKAGDKVDLMDFHIFILINLFGFIKVMNDEITGKPMLDEFPVYNDNDDIIGYEQREVYVRRFNQALILVARKNAKSFLATGIALYMLKFDEESGAEIYSAATKKDQAKIVFDDAREMVKKSEMLAAEIETTKFAIYDPESYSKFIPLASEADSLDGLNIHLGILDEIHAMKKRDLYDVMETATGSRRQPLILCITTAGFILDGICVELSNYGSAILNSSSGEGDNFFYLCFEIDEDDDRWNPDIWYKANPGLGACKSLQNMIDIADKAKETPTARNNFFTKYLNIFVNGSSNWLEMEKYHRLFNVNPAGCKYWVGVDMSTKIDLCAAAKVYRADTGQFNGNICIRIKLWLPEGRLDSCSKSQRDMYERWVASGILKLTDGDVIDQNIIEEDIINWINEDKEYFVELAYDPWQAQQFAINMITKHELQCVEVTQTVKNLNEAMVYFQELVYSRKCHVEKNNALEWQFSNVIVKKDKNGNIFPDKSVKERKIDCPSAIFNACARIVRTVVSGSRLINPDEWGTL
ncbi:terminase large subunit [Dickeya phage Sucellus]|nr:terminase large subunit [Dickeya phage Sucellus]